MKLPHGWLQRQHEAVSRDIAAWPEWMKREGGFTTEQSPDKQEPAMIYCPNCRQSLTVAHLRSHEECSKVVASVCGIYRVSKRTKAQEAGPGRPKGSKDKVPRKRRTDAPSAGD